MWAFDEKTSFENVEEKEDESWRDFYYRASEETGLLKFSDEEKAFIKRLQARADELRKLNFDVPEDLRVNMQNLINASQLTHFDKRLSQQLDQAGFAIAPATHDQLSHAQHQNN